MEIGVIVLRPMGTADTRCIKKRGKVRLLVGRVSAVRARTMTAIKSKNTKAELALRTALRSKNLKYRIHMAGLPGKPDVVFPREKLIVFCDGDFWHGRNWEERKRKAIKVRRAYWIKKIEGNMARDKRNNRELRKGGWKVLRLWETDILKNPEKAALRVERALFRQQPVT